MATKIVVGEPKRSIPWKFQPQFGQKLRILVFYQIKKEKCQKIFLGKFYSEITYTMAKMTKYFISTLLFAILKLQICDLNIK